MLEIEGTDGTRFIKKKQKQKTPQKQKTNQLQLQISLCSMSDKYFTN